MRTLTALLALLLLAAPATAQDSTATDTVPDAPSLREIRQRAGYALSRADNLQAEIAAAIDHLIRLRSMTDSAVARDSILERPESATDTVLVTDTVRVAPDSVPPFEPPGRPISFQPDSATVIVSWGAAEGARWYNWSSSAGRGFTTDTTARIPLDAGGWLCLWANNAAGQNPATDGVCTSVDSSDVAVAPDTLPAPELLAIEEVSRTDSTITYRATWSCVEGAEWYAVSAGSNSGRWSWSDSVPAPDTCTETVDGTLVMRRPR